MNEEHFTIDKSTPVVYAFKFKSGLDRSDSLLKRRLEIGVQFIESGQMVVGIGLPFRIAE